MALSKNRIKYIHSLEQKKNRKADKVFLAEGPKLVGDLLGHFPCQFLLATSEWLSRNRPLSTVTDVTELKRIKAIPHNSNSSLLTKNFPHNQKEPKHDRP